MKTILQTILIVFLITFFSECKKNNGGISDGIHVKVFECNDSVEIIPRNFICVDSIFDSRCPDGGECIWSGTAIAKVRVQNNIKPFKIAIRGFPNIGFTNDTIINGYRIQFTKLEPYPAIGHLINMKDYVATFKITR